MYPVVLELAAPDAPMRVPVVVYCRVLGFTKQAFYKWKKYLAPNGSGLMST